MEIREREAVSAELAGYFNCVKGNWGNFNINKRLRGNEEEVINFNR